MAAIAADMHRTISDLRAIDLHNHVIFSQHLAGRGQRIKLVDEAARAGERHLKTQVWSIIACLSCLSKLCRAGCYTAPIHDPVLTVCI